jgi:hypothetical protein
MNKRKCRHCKDYFNPVDGIIVPVGFYCSYEHMREHTRPKAKAIYIKREKVAKKAKEKDLMTRTKWHQKLQSVVNQYIVHVRDRRRFIEMNLHKQCSMQCNQHGGGMPEIYAQRITETYGLDKLEWLKGVHNHPLLKERFPHWSDVEIEINRYRQLLRDNGLKPNV